MAASTRTNVKRLTSVSCRAKVEYSDLLEILKTFSALEKSKMHAKSHIYLARKTPTR